MAVDEATIQTLINTIRERPELLRELNVAIATVMDKAGIDPDEMSQAEVFDALTRWLAASQNEGDEK